MRSWIKLSNTRSHRHDFDTDDLDFAQIPKGRCPISPIKFLTMWNWVMEVRTWGFAFALIWAPRTCTKSWSGRRFSMKVLHPTRKGLATQLGKQWQTVQLLWPHLGKLTDMRQIYTKVCIIDENIHVDLWEAYHSLTPGCHEDVDSLDATKYQNGSNGRFFENEVDSTSWFAAGKKEYQFHHVGQASQNIDSGDQLPTQL